MPSESFNVEIDGKVAEVQQDLSKTSVTLDGLESLADKFAEVYEAEKSFDDIDFTLTPKQGFINLKWSETAHRAIQTIPRCAFSNNLWSMLGYKEVTAPMNVIFAFLQCVKEYLGKDVVNFGDDFKFAEMCHDEENCQCDK